MKLIYGVKMIDKDDIIAASKGRHEKICDHLQRLIIRGKLDVAREFQNITISIGAQGSYQIVNTLKSYVLIFVPKDLVEKYLIKESIVPNLRAINEMFPRRNKIEKTINRYESDYSDVELKYLEKESIKKTSCYMFIFENDKFFDVYLGDSESIISHLMKPEIYTCSICGATEQPDKTSLTQYLPLMRYDVIDGLTIYICEKCAYEKHMTDLRHVGE